MSEREPRIAPVFSQIQRAEDDARHAAAMSIVERKVFENRPFILYLRKFKILRGIRFGAASIPTRFLWQEFADLHAAGIDTLMIRQDVQFLEDGLPDHLAQTEHPFSKDRFQRESPPKTTPLPGFMVSDDLWKQVVAELIDLADVICIEHQMGGDGVGFEVEACLQKGKVLNTIIVLPDLDDDLPFVQSVDEVVGTSMMLFPRTIFCGELQDTSLPKHPLAFELFQFLDVLKAGLPDEDDAPKKLRELLEFPNSLSVYARWIRSLELSDEWMLYAWTRVATIIGIRIELNKLTVTQLAIFALMHASMGLIHYRRGELQEARQSYEAGRNNLAHAESMAPQDDHHFTDCAFVTHTRLKRLEMSLSLKNQGDD